MKIGKLKLFGRLREKIDGVIHRLLRPHVGRIIERMTAEVYECEDEDVPDCEVCEHCDVCMDRVLNEHLDRTWDEAWDELADRASGRYPRFIELKDRRDIN